MSHVQGVLPGSGSGSGVHAASGAAFTESLRRGLAGGFRPALAVQIGSLLGDAVWAVLGLAGVGVLFAHPMLRIPLTAAGCLMLGWWGFQGLRNATFPARSTGAPSKAPGRATALSAGASMSLGNPLNVAYGSGTAGAVGAVLGRGTAFADLAAFFAGFMVSALAWCFLCAAGITLLHRALAAAAVRVVEALCAAALLGLAALTVVRLITENTG